MQPPTPGAGALPTVDQAVAAAWDRVFRIPPIMLGTTQCHGAAESIRCHPLVGTSSQRSNQKCRKSGQ